MSVFQKGNLALITSGASGLGLAVAELCVKHGMRVALVDTNHDALILAAKNLSSLAGSVDHIGTFRVDVSQTNHWTYMKEAVKSRFNLGEGELPDLLMLNGGVATQGSWGDGEYFSKNFNTNLLGVVRGLNTYVPLYQARKTSKPSAIVITGSKLGITNPPGNPAYNASEAAVKSLAEHLSFDLRDSATNVHLLMPGWTHTGLSGNTPDSTTPTKPDGAWYASQVASYMYQKMKDYKFYIICPDNDVSEAAAKKRMLWSVGDMVKGRPPLSRWRPEFKAEAEKWMAECDMDEGSEVAGWCLIESAGL